MKENNKGESSASECYSSGDEDKPKEVCQGPATQGDVLDNLISDVGPDDSNQSDADNTSTIRIKKRMRVFSDSDEGSVINTADKDQNKNDFFNENECESASKHNLPKSETVNMARARLRKMPSSGEESDSSSSNNEEGESRIHSKRNKLKQKFKNMHNKKTKKSKPKAKIEIEQENIPEEKSEKSHSSSDEESSIKKIKQIIKEHNTTQLKSSLYDPDTSDEETSIPHREVSAQKGRKSTKPTSPKPLRMSAKQAMENMQKIKSESNRMLREKDVSLPYHRPKALTLKDIMSRKRAAVAPDGKALPIKMNNEQLKQYVQILEQRQKEVIELCKSDTDEEEGEEEQAVEIKEQLKKAEDNLESLSEVASLNDTLYDDLSTAKDGVDTNTDINSENFISDVDTKNYSDEVNKSNDVTKFNEEILNSETIQTDININDIKSRTDDVEEMSLDETPNEPLPGKNQENHALDENNSMEMELVYNDSVEDMSTETENTKGVENTDNTKATDKTKTDSEVESQLISLHYDTEKSEINGDVESIDKDKKGPSRKSDEEESEGNEMHSNDFSDDDMNIEDIDALIENAEISTSQSNTGIVNSPMLIKEPLSLSAKPKLTGTPGMVIDLDGTDPFVPKKLTGVELLKQRYVYFSKLKTPEEHEREREKRIKPGMQHLKLKQELEQQIAEQRSLEWAKRLEDEKQHQKELNALRGEGSDAEDDIDAIEAKLDEKEVAVEKESSSEGEEEEEEELEQEITDKPRKSNPMIDDEAEESDCDNETENGNNDAQMGDVDEIKGDENDDDAGNEADESEEESSEESEESEDEQQSKPKKGRILKAFEDSDDEDALKINDDIKKTEDMDQVTNQIINKSTQDDELHLAQKSVSEDLFTSQESSIAHSSKSKSTSNVKDSSFEDKQLGTQTFSILECTSQKDTDVDFPMPDTLSNPRDTQSYGGDSFDAVVGMCSGSFSQTQNLVPPSQISAEVPVSQTIGDDVLALCTGQFYDNQFVSQIDAENKGKSDENVANKFNNNGDFALEIDNDSGTNNDKFIAPSNSIDKTENINTKDKNQIEKNETRNEKKMTSEDPNLKSILDELNDPEFHTLKPNKYFMGNDSQDKKSIDNVQFKKKFIIDSDEEDKEKDMSIKKKKKIKKKKMEQRALQISDDEEDEQEEVEEYESELEEEDAEQIVEYDSDENEVAVVQRPKKRKAGEFFEQEAELTSEDEWAGSGDEDEAGLDRMEREAGDDDTFNQRQLQRELGQIHMRDVLDQDKREVRLIQELLFEDGDLGAGSRQRKFRWKNADGEEPTGAADGEFADTQEEEFESEEQWRKQRHEREMFLKSLKNQEEQEESLNITMNRTTIIKANLKTKNASNLFVDINTSIEEAESPVAEKKTASAKDIPSPKKPFTIFQQNYHGSLLTRGGGALARLAALATPLANDDDTPRVGSLKPTSKMNFVFTSIDAPTPDENEPKVTKRKADNNAGTPKLVKKMRTEDKLKYSKSSLLDHMKT